MEGTYSEGGLDQDCQALFRGIDDFVTAGRGKGRSGGRRRWGAVAGGLAIAMVLALSILPPARATSLTSVTIAGPQSLTMQVQPLPCLPEFGIVTITGQGVFHFNFDKAGDGWFTATITGAFTFTPTDGSYNVLAPGPGVVSFTGQATSWFGQNFNLQNLQGTGIIEVNAVGSDESTLNVHIVFSVVLLPSGTMMLTANNLVCGS